MPEKVSKLTRVPAILYKKLVSAVSQWEVLQSKEDEGGNMVDGKYF